MPAIALGTIPMAIIARMTRSSMLEVLSADYIRTAHAKGLRERSVVIRHALRNAWLPIITVVGLQVGTFVRRHPDRNGLFMAGDRSLVGRSHLLARLSNRPGRDPLSLRSFSWRSICIVDILYAMVIRESGLNKGITLVHSAFARPSPKGVM